MNKANPKVSVVVPTYNYGRFITKALESVKCQTYPPYEVIVIDDGSYDGTAEVIKALDWRLRYVIQERAGVSAARNRGVAESGGDYIAFLDADDLWEPTKLEKQLKKFLEDPELGMVHCGMREFDNDTGRTLALHLSGGTGWVARRIAAWEEPVVIGPGGTILISRKAFDTVGGFDASLRYGEDWEFCFRVAQKFRIGFVEEPLLHYRNHGNNSTRDVAEMERSTLIAWEKVFHTDDSNIRKVRRGSYGNLFMALAGSYYRSGNLPRFLLSAARSIYYRPSKIVSLLGFPLRQLRRTRDS